MNNVTNDLLMIFGNRWKLEGDWLRCRRCRRPHIASKADQEFSHRSGCIAEGNVETHPWLRLRDILTGEAERAEGGRSNRAGVLGCQAGGVG